MNTRILNVLLLPIYAVLAAYVWLSSAGLPATVASHFGSDGTANGLSSRGGYTVAMLVLAVLVPAVVGLLPGLLARHAGGLINIPNRDYWLAPERKRQTEDFLALGGVAFGLALAVFMAHLHTLVVQANRLVPPQLPLASVAPGLVLLLACCAAWVLLLALRFRRPGP
jgi:uncharacterized membrane protein